MKQQVIKSLADHQIDALIKKGENVSELKKEWRKRWAMDYPYYKDCVGIKQL